MSVKTSLIEERLGEELQRLNTENTIEDLEACLRKKNPHMADFFLGALQDFLVDLTEYIMEITDHNEQSEWKGSKGVLSTVLSPRKESECEKEEVISSLEKRYGLKRQQLRHCIVIGDVTGWKMQRHVWSWKWRDVLQTTEMNMVETFVKYSTSDPDLSDLLQLAVRMEKNKVSSAAGDSSDLVDPGQSHHDLDLEGQIADNEESMENASKDVITSAKDEADIMCRFMSSGEVYEQDIEAGFTDFDSQFSNEWNRNKYY